MSKESTTVKILGASYKIACPAEESEELKKAAKFLDSKLNEVKQASGLDEKRAAIITALNISNEYLKNLSSVGIDEAVNKDLEGLTLEIQEQLKSLSFKAK